MSRECICEPFYSERGFHDIGVDCPCSPYSTAARNEPVIIPKEIWEKMRNNPTIVPRGNIRIEGERDG